MEVKPVQRCRHVALGCSLAGATACGDEVVGYFDTGSASTASTAADTGSSDGAPASATGDEGFVAPGCFGDDFDNGFVDALWNTWIEQDAALAERNGRLELTPPTFGIWDTGVVGAYNYVFPFASGHARLRVPVPPATSRPVLLFLIVHDGGDTSLSMQLVEGTVVVQGSIGEQVQYWDAFPMDPYPAWLQIRAEGDVAHFEVSDDGVGFTLVATRDKMTSFAQATALIMAQTFSEDLDRGFVGVDDFEVCVQ